MNAINENGTESNEILSRTKNLLFIKTKHAAAIEHNQYDYGFVFFF